MDETTEVKHKIQKYILSILLCQSEVRFRDMRPPHVDTNLYSYHLTKLIKNGFVKKTNDGYTLDTAGLIYAENLNLEDLSGHTSPGVITMLVIQNSNGDVLLKLRHKQPYIYKWTLPYGRVNGDDKTVLIAAQRVVKGVLYLQNQTLTPAGDCYIRVHRGDIAITTTLVHVFTFNSDDIQPSSELLWARPHKISKLDLAPAVEKIITRSFFHDPFFFEEFDEALKIDI